MAYEMMFFPKKAMPHTVPLQTDFAIDMYATYADSFDVSLLKSDNYSNNSSSSNNEIVSHSSTQIMNGSNMKKRNTVTVAEVASQLSPTCYIPTTVFSAEEKKTPWNAPTTDNRNTVVGDTTSFMYNSNNNNNNSYKLNLYTCPLPSPPQDTVSSTISVMSPPSYNSNKVDIMNWVRDIKQEHIILPPSPPESDSAFESDADVVKNESDAEPCMDIEYFLKNSFDSMNQASSHKCNNNNNSSNNSSTRKSQQQQQDHQFLRECLQDTTFQKRHNLRPIALESLFGGWNLRGDMEPVISLALEQAKCDIRATCMELDISPDPREWTTEQVQSWLRSTMRQFKMQQMPNMETLFPENGQELSQLTEDEFVQRCPQAGSTLHGQLEVWKVSCTDESFISTINDDQQSQYSAMSIDEPSDIIMNIKNEVDADVSTLVVTPSNSTTPRPPSSTAVAQLTPTTISTANTTLPTNVTNPCGTQTPTSTSIVKATSTTTTTTTTKVSRHGSAHIHLWQFLKELLGQPQTYGTALRWLDRKQGIFKIEDSVRVARLWGRRKNRPAMNYDKLSRSIRQYYKKGIMKKTERSQRLVYQFCHPYFL